MVCINWKSITTNVFIFGAILVASYPVLAQWSSSISAGEIIDPWEQHLAVLQSLSGSISSVADDETGAQLAKNLAALESGIDEFGLEIDEFINRLAGDPQFVYVAAETSLAMSTPLAQVYAQFESLYLALGVQKRDDVITAQASLEALRKVLHEKRKFENDVTNALAIGARQPLVALATRWWKGKEKSIEVQKVAANLRQQLIGVTASEEPK
jgi:hypothetical protein